MVMNCQNLTPLLMHRKFWPFDQANKKLMKTSFQNAKCKTQKAKRKMQNAKCLFGQLNCKTGIPLCATNKDYIVDGIFQ